VSHIIIIYRSLGILCGTDYAVTYLILSRAVSHTLPRMIRIGHLFLLPISDRSGLVITDVCTIPETLKDITRVFRIYHLKVPAASYDL